MPLSDNDLEAEVERACAHLASEGYHVVPGAVAADQMARLDRDLSDPFERTPFCDGDFYGRRTKRFGGLLKHSPHVEPLVRHPLVLAIAERMLGPWCDRMILNLTQAIEIHPGALAQLPHRDQDMWRGPKGQVEYLINVIWPLSSFIADNGATRLWPRSRVGEGEPLSLDDPIAIEMEPGSALLFLGSTLHGGGENRRQTVRRGIIVSYCLGWLRTFENQYLVYPPAIARNFDPKLAALVGYAQHRPNLGNVGGQCPSVLLHRDGIEGLPAIDALLPEQTDMLDAYVADQEAARAGLLGG